MSDKKHSPLMSLHLGVLQIILITEGEVGIKRKERRHQMNDSKGQRLL